MGDSFVSHCRLLCTVFAVVHVYPVEISLLRNKRDKIKLQFQQDSKIMQVTSTENRTTAL